MDEDIQRQDLLDLMAPRSRWPNLDYLAKAAAIYAAWAVFIAVTCFLAVVIYAFPLNVAIFVAGVATAALVKRLWDAGYGRSAVDRLGTFLRVVCGLGAIPTH